MKTLEQIIDEVEMNERPDYDDLRYALLAMKFICNDLTRNFNELLCGRWSDLKIQIKQHEKSLYGKALGKNPKEFIGWNYDPENPEYQRFHSIGKRIVEKALKGELPNQKNESSQ